MSKKNEEESHQAKRRWVECCSYTWNSAIWVDAFERFFFEILEFSPTALVGEAKLFEDDEDFGRVWNKV